MNFFIGLVLVTIAVFIEPSVAQPVKSKTNAVKPNSDFFIAVSKKILAILPKASLR